jgi:CRP/FNR family cyclic AMP-dependent transcriptional regulator
MKILKSRRKSKPPRLSYSSGDKLIKMINVIMPFKGLESAELASIFDNVHIKTYPVGSMVFMPGDATHDQLYILRKGRVDLYRLTARGKRLVTAQILPGEVFGVRAVLGQTIQGNFAEAIEDSTVCIVSKKQLLIYLKHHPDLLLSLLEAACYALYLLEERLTEAVYGSVLSRLGHFLLTNADPASGTLNNMTQEDIGNMVGAVRQTVTEKLSLMQKQGLIHIRPKQIKIIDKHGLENIMQTENITS